jgi:hypothetical protein
MEIYKILPNELQYVIKKYFHIYERWGITNMRYIKPDPNNNYYNKIRKCPRGMKWNPLYNINNTNVLYYRRQKHDFQWDLRVRTHENGDHHFYLSLIPQWDNYDGDLYDQLFNYSFYNDIEPPIPISSVTIYENENSMLIKYIIQKPLLQSKQAYLNEFYIYLKLLSEHVDKIVKNIKRYNHIK